MTKKIFFLLFFSFISVTHLFTPASVSAQACRELCLAQGNTPSNCNSLPACPPCTPGAGIELGSCLILSDDTPVRDKYSSASFLVDLIVRNLFVFGGIILFGLIFFAGYKFILGGKKGVEEARSVISTAIVGFIIMISAYWIVQIVKIVTGADIQI